MTELERGKATYSRRSWDVAFLEWSAADSKGQLAAEDIERLAFTAHMTGRDAVGIELLTRAHQAFLTRVASRSRRAAQRFTIDSVTITEIRQVASLTDIERRELHDWGADIFGMAQFGLTFRPETTHLLLYTQDGVASHVGLVKDAIHVNDQRVIVGGVCGVVTVPQAQRRGYARVLMEHAVIVMQEWMVDGGLLFCVDAMVRYYKALGWIVVKGPVLIEQPMGVIASPIPVMVLPLNNALRNIDRVELRGLPW